MFYSVDYKSKRLEQADEIRCPVNQLGLIYDFIKEHPDKRYNVILNKWAEDDQIEKVKEQIEYIKAAGADYTICCNTLIEAQVLINEGYNAYHNIPITDWEMFDTYLYQRNFSDVWIDGPLGFQIDELKSITGYGGVIRAIPNQPLNGIKGFYIRPEDIYLYENGITMIELSNDIEFDIYKRGVFNQDINLIIHGFPDSLNNSMISEEFGKHRLNCGQWCMVPSRHCHYCDIEFNIVKNSIKLLTEDNTDDVVE